MKTKLRKIADMLAYIAGRFAGVNADTDSLLYDGYMRFLKDTLSVAHDCLKDGADAENNYLSVVCLVESALARESEFSGEQRDTIREVLTLPVRKNESFTFNDVERARLAFCNAGILTGPRIDLPNLSAADVAAMDGDE